MKDNESVQSKIMNIHTFQLSRLPRKSPGFDVLSPGLPIHLDHFPGSKTYKPPPGFFSLSWQISLCCVWFRGKRALQNLGAVLYSICRFLWKNIGVLVYLFCARGFTSKMASKRTQDDETLVSSSDDERKEWTSAESKRKYTGSF